MTDEELDREQDRICRKLKIPPNGPNYHDVWRHGCLKDEFTRRGRIPDGGFD